jgi:hypothetical protein
MNDHSATKKAVRLELPESKSPVTTLKGKGKGCSSSGTGLEWPRWFEEVKVPRFHDNGTGWW